MNNIQYNDYPEQESTLTEDEVRLNKEKALQTLDELIESFITSPEMIKKGNNLSYWLSQYSIYLGFENSFQPDKLKKYKRGDVIKVNLGFNIGNELGGLHYCIVLDVSNAMKSGTVTVVPLTSCKDMKQYHTSTVNLGNEIYQNLKRKFEQAQGVFTKEATEIISLKKSSSSFTESQSLEFSKKLSKAMEDLAFAEKLRREIERMKKGSIALVGQITTVSKQRIYDPQNYKDIMSGIRISADSLTLIDNKLKELFTKIV